MGVPDGDPVRMHAAQDFGTRAAVANGDDAVYARCDIGVVRDDDDRHTEATVKVAEEFEHHPGANRIKLACRFVGQEQRRVVGERNRDGDALLFAARHLYRAVVHAVGEPNRGKQLRCAAAGSGLRHAIEDERDFHVLQRIEIRDEVSARLLPYETDLLAPVPHHLRFGDGYEVFAADECPASRWLVQPGEDVEERAFPRTRRADDRHQLAALDFEVQPAQSDDLEIGDLVDLEEVFAMNIRQLIGRSGAG